VLLKFSALYHNAPLDASFTLSSSTFLVEDIAMIYSCISADRFCGVYVCVCRVRLNLCLGGVPSYGEIIGTPLVRKLTYIIRNLPRD
jgi:hypothetical protein